VHSKKKTPTDYETKLRKRQTGLGSPKYPRITALSPSHFRVMEFWDLFDDSTALRSSSLASLYFESHETFLHSLRKGGLLITLKCLFKSFPTLLAYIIILYLLRKCLVRTTISFYANKSQSTADERKKNTTLCGRSQKCAADTSIRLHFQFL